MGTCADNAQRSLHIPKMNRPEAFAHDFQCQSIHPPMTELVDLHTPLRLPCGVILPNRILKSAMTEGLADLHDRATPLHSRLYRRWSEGGTGTLVTGNVMVDRRYLERPGNVVVEGDAALAFLTPWAEAGVAGGNQLWMQISHPGRQCSRLVAATPVAPSAVQLELGGLFGKPRALAEHEIVDIVGRYAGVARVAQRAGFTGVQRPWGGGTRSSTRR
jgi:2,4-dienoyl-CoA reductase-like NADH-dependent reductase (Old Yellow Enzyme family)